MASEIQNSSEENNRIIEEVQNIVQRDEITAQNLTTRSVSLERKVNEAFIKMPRSNNQEEQAFGSLLLRFCCCCCSGQRIEE
mgnify:CR=1 FL=1